MMRHCLRLYKKYNMENASFRSIQSMADFYFLMNEFDSTNIYIKKIDNMYKRISHVKDMSSMNYFNYYKGKYYERINKLDSAEYYYRQLPSFGYGREGYSGLLRIYCEKQCPDSIKKYQNLYEKSIDENEKSNQAKALLQASAMYDYGRLHKENSKSKYNAMRIKYALWSLTATIIVVLYALYYGFRIYRKRRRNEKEELVKSIMMLKIKLKSKEDIINKMTLDGITMYKAQNEVNRLKVSVKTYESNENYDTKDTLLLMERLSERFKLLSCPKPGSMRPDEDDWHCLEEFFLKKMIRLIELFHRSNLSQQELRVCMLTFIGVPSSSISVLINSSPQRITNIKTSSNMKIFGERNAKTLIQNLKKA